MKKFNIEFIAQCDESYLYEITTPHNRFYAYSDGAECGCEEFTYNSELYVKDDFTEREWKIAKYLFNFLWNSENGTNTCAERDIYEDDGFTPDEMKSFVEKFGGDGLEFIDENVEIYWLFLCSFDLSKANVFEECDND